MYYRPSSPPSVRSPFTFASMSSTHPPTSTSTFPTLTTTSGTSKTAAAPFLSSTSTALSNVARAAISSFSITTSTTLTGEEDQDPLAKPPRLSWQKYTMWFCIATAIFIAIMTILCYTRRGGRHALRRDLSRMCRPFSRLFRFLGSCLSHIGACLAVTGALLTECISGICNWARPRGFDIRAGIMVVAVLAVVGGVAYCYGRPRTEVSLWGEGGDSTASLVGRDVATRTVVG